MAVHENCGLKNSHWCIESSMSPRLSRCPRRQAHCRRLPSCWQLEDRCNDDAMPCNHEGDARIGPRRGPKASNKVKALSGWNRQDCFAKKASRTKLYLNALRRVQNWRKRGREKTTLILAEFIRVLFMPAAADRKRTQRVMSALEVDPASPTYIAMILSGLLTYLRLEDSSNIRA